MNNSTDKPIAFGLISAGKRIYIQSQIHSNETHGTPVLFGLIRKLEGIKVEGEVVIWPCVNEEGFHDYCISRKGLFDPDNGQNWNRIEFSYFNPIVSYFESKKERVESKEDIEKLIDDLDLKLIEGDYGIKKHVYNFWEPLKIALKSKYIIDIHTPEFGVEHLYCNKETSFVKSFNISPIIIDDTDSATFRNFMTKLLNSLAQIKNRSFAEYFFGREVVTVELPSHKYIDDEYIYNWSERFLDILNTSNFIDKREIKEQIMSEVQIYNIKSLKYYYAKTDGIIIMMVPVGSVIEKNEVFLKIISIDGGQQLVRAVNKGKFLCFRDKKTALRGEWIARVLEFD